MNIKIGSVSSGSGPPAVIGGNGFLNIWFQREMCVITTTIIMNNGTIDVHKFCSSMVCGAFYKAK